MSSKLEKLFRVSLLGWRSGFGRMTLGTLLVASALFVGFLMISPLPPMADEPHHVSQIHLLMQGEWMLVPSLTTLPGYHALIAAIGALVGRGDLPALRLYSLILSIAALATLFVLARDAGDGCAVERSLQIAFLPILFPLFFFVYTDVTAILFLALALLLQRRGRYWLAAATATAALAVRQNYIVWFGFAALLLAIEVARSPVMTVVGGRIVANARALLSRATAADLVARAAGYIVGLGLFAAFLAWNRGIAVGDREMHPFPTVQFGNIYFALFLVFFFFLPLHLKNARQISQLLVRPVTILTLAGLLLFFLVTFRTEHPYNQPALRWWLHNALLASLTSSVWAKLAMFGAMAVALLSLRVTPLRESSHYLVYPFAVISLLPAWQIEQRYYIAPLVLFLLFRVQTSPSLEWLLIAYLAAFTGILFLGIANGAYFL